MVKLFDGAIAAFSSPDATSPEGFAQEVLNAVSMLFPIVNALALLRNLPPSAGCPQCGWAIFWASVVHLPFSILYHVVCGMISRGWCIDDTTWRCMDQSGIHIMFTVIACGLSRSWTFAVLIVVPFNIYSITLLWSRSQTEARHCCFVRMGVALGIKLISLTWCADFSAIVGVGICWLMGAIFFCVDRLFLGGWGHMMMHLLIVPTSQMLITSAVRM
jgi:hypothetical protein